MIKNTCSALQPVILFNCVYRAYNENDKSCISAKQRFNIGLKRFSYGKAKFYWKVPPNLVNVPPSKFPKNYVKITIFYFKS